jgi:hypothetical protein
VPADVYSDEQACGMVASKFSQKYETKLLIGVTERMQPRLKTVHPER